MAHEARLTLSDTPAHPIRKQHAAALRAMEAAVLALNGASVPEAAKQYGAGVTSTHAAVLLLRFGTSEEIAAVRNGTALADVADAVRLRVPKSERAIRPPTFTQAVLDSRRFDALVWSELSRGIAGLTSLPHPKEVVKICRDNVSRRRMVDEKLLIALEWLEEFSDAWTK